MEFLKLDGACNGKHKDVRRHYMAQEMAKKFHESGFQGFSDYLMEVFNVDVRYEKNTDDPDRRKLNSESGFIISNHPGYIDTPAILNTLTRKPTDLKMVIAERGYEAYSQAIGNGIFISTPRNYSVSAGRKMIEEGVEHIQNHNGVLIMYPTDGLDKKTKVEFRSGFRMILNEIPDNKMVYCFNFRIKETENIINKLGMAGLLSEAMSLPLNINKLKSPAALNVAERYTRAGEWKSLIGGLNKPRANEVLRDYYLELFS